MIENREKFGFRWNVDHIRNGQVIAHEEVDNLVPIEGKNYVLGSAFKGATPQSSWFCGLYEGNYTPGNSATAANIASTATECSAYEQSSRPAWVGGDVVDGSVSNDANRAQFTFDLASGQTKTIYGGFLISNAVKGGAQGVLASVVRFPSPKVVEDGDVLRIYAGSTLVSA